jgi:2-oxoglutarate ferredoxin oxidoreductase subunit beta
MKLLIKLRRLKMLDYEKYLRYRTFPVPWCPGCGIGTIFKAVAMTFSKLEWEPNDIAVVSGIGCSGRLSTYFNTNSLHTTHGRALTFATGVKLSNPDKHVVVFSGDGDALAIGGNHFIHACRRNLNMKMVVINNNIYGMTGGQVSPTTPTGFISTTTPYGNTEPHFNTVELAKAAGATYVARETVNRPRQLLKVLEKAFKHTGFAVVEVISNCHINLGRRNKLKHPIPMLNWINQQTVPIAKAKDMSDEELELKYVVGEFVHRHRPDYFEVYKNNVVKKAKGE